MDHIISYIQDNYLSIFLFIASILGSVIGTKRFTTAAVLKESGEALTAIGEFVKSTDKKTFQKVLTEADDFRKALTTFGSK